MMDPDASNYYDRLDLSRHASKAEIEESGREYPTTHHPDQSEEDDATEQFVRLNKAYKCLSDGTDRRAYDTFSDRFGPENATEVFERWCSVNRPVPPEHYPSGGVSRASSRSASSTETAESKSGTRNGSGESQGESPADDGGVGAQSHDTDDGARSSDHSTTTGSNTSESGTTSSNYSAYRTSRNSDDPSSGRWGTEDRDDSTRSNTWRTYSAPDSFSIGSYLGLQIRLSAAEGMLGLSVAAMAVGVAVLLVISAIVTVVLMYPVELLLRPFGAGVTLVTGDEVDTMLVSEVVLTYFLEVIAFAVVIWLADLLYYTFVSSHASEWDEHLGNRIRYPFLLLASPVVIGAAFVVATNDPALESVSANSGMPIVVLGYGTALLSVLYRTTRIAVETPIGKAQGSLVDLGTRVAWTGTVGSLLLAWFVAGIVALGIDYDFATEYTLVMNHLSPSILFVVSCVFVVIWVGVTGLRIAGHHVRTVVA